MYGHARDASSAGSTDSAASPGAGAFTFHGTMTPDVFPPFSGPDGVTRLPVALPPRPAFESVAYLPLDGTVVPTAFVRDKLANLGALSRPRSSFLLASDPQA